MSPFTVGTPTTPSPSHLHRDPLGNVHDELHIGVVVVIGSSWDRDVLVRHLDVFWDHTGGKRRELLTGRRQTQPTSLLHREDPKATVDNPR